MQTRETWTDLGRRFPQRNQIPLFPQLTINQTQEEEEEEDGEVVRE